AGIAASVWQDIPPKTDSLTGLYILDFSGLSASGFSKQDLQAVGSITIRQICPVWLIGSGLVWHRPCLTPSRREASKIRNGFRSFATLKNPFFPPDVMGAFSHNPKA